MHFFRLVAALIALFLLSGCGGNASDGSASSQNPTGNASAPSDGSVQITGKITYDRVPHSIRSGLDYDRTIKAPIRGAVVEAVSASGAVIASTISDESGLYTFAVDANSNIQIQIKSQLFSEGSAKWNFKVTDNTQGNQLYALQGRLENSGEKSRQTRNLHAPHGWTGLHYTDVRAAAPFAILDSVYVAVRTFSEIDETIIFPDLEIRWSPNNKTVLGNKALGQIGTSAYFPEIDGGTIYLLGDEGRDTDEYDPHVILHEWGHYFEHRLSRTDSPGGLHSLDDRLDPRVAFSEAWANALSGVLTGDPIYKDSSGERQSAGFSFNLERDKIVNPGWFSQASIGSILYDIMDSQSDGADDLSAGLGPLDAVMRSDAYKDGPVFSTIFALSDAMRTQFPETGARLTDLLTAQSIFGEGPNGDGEVNSGAIRTALPVYKEVRLNGAATEVCSVDDAGLHNKLGNREFIFLKLEADTNVTLSLLKTSGDENRDPDLKIWQGNQLLHSSASSAKGQEVIQRRLSAGEYVIEAFDFFNINGVGSKRGDGCYSFHVTG